MIRDRIVVGLLDTALSEKFLLDPELTLEKAMTTARQREMVRKQQTVLRNEEQPVQIDIAESDKKHRYRDHKPRPNQHKKQLSTVQQPLCSWCGKRHSKGRDHCPARVAVCHRCKKRGTLSSSVQIQAQNVSNGKKKSGLCISAVLTVITLL